MKSRIGLALAAAIGLPTLYACAAQVAAAKLAAAEARGAPEKCFGVARAGLNDCRTQRNVCAGWSHQDRDPSAFVFVPAGSCSRIVGGRMEEGAGR